MRPPIQNPIQETDWLRLRSKRGCGAKGEFNYKLLIHFTNEWMASSLCVRFISQSRLRNVTVLWNMQSTLSENWLYGWLKPIVCASHGLIVRFRLVVMVVVIEMESRIRMRRIQSSSKSCIQKMKSSLWDSLQSYGNASSESQAQSRLTNMCNTGPVLDLPARRR